MTSLHIQLGHMIPIMPSTSY